MSTSGSAPAAIRVVIVDDDLFVRESLSDYLSVAPDIDVVGTCSDGAGALEAVGSWHPHIVLMDIRMRTMDGPAATRAITREHPEVKVLALTSFGDDDAIREMFASGACGFLLKSTRAPAMANAIRAAHSGITVVPSDAIRHWSEQRTSGQKPNLEPLEWEVLRRLDLGLTNRAIAQQLFISTSSVKRHVNSLMKKLDATTRTQVVARAHALGLLPT